MPGRDGTGPLGMGSMTGRRMGFCVGSGFGARGMGRGRGWFYGASFPDQAPYPEAGKNYLKNRAEALQAELESVRKRLSELEEDAGR